MTKVIKVPESHLEVISSPQQESQPTALSQLKYAEPTELYLRRDSTAGCESGEDEASSGESSQEAALCATAQTLTKAPTTTGSA